MWVDGKKCLHVSDIFHGGDLDVQISADGGWVAASGNGAWVDGKRVLNDADVHDRGQVSVALRPR